MAQSTTRALGNVTAIALLLVITLMAAAIVGPYLLGMADVVDSSEARAADVVAGGLDDPTSTPTATPTPTPTPTATPTPTPEFDITADVERSVIDWDVRQSVDADTLTVEHTAGALPSDLALEVKGYRFAWSTYAVGDTVSISRDDVPTTGLNLNGATVRLVADGDVLAETTLPA